MTLLQTQIRTSRITDGRYAVAVSGDLDLDVAPILRARLAELVEAGATTIVIDLLDVSLIDSAGLSVLVDLGRALKSSRGELVLVVDNLSVTKLLTISGAGRWFRIESSLLRAVNRIVDASA